jgi:hypothetical protein
MIYFVKFYVYMTYISNSIILHPIWFGRSGIFYVFGVDYYFLVVSFVFFDERHSLYIYIYFSFQNRNSKFSHNQISKIYRF